MNIETLLLHVNTLEVAQQCSIENIQNWNSDIIFDIKKNKIIFLLKLRNKKAFNVTNQNTGYKCIILSRVFAYLKKN